MAAPTRENVPADGAIGNGAYLVGKFNPQKTNAQIVLGAKADPYEVGEVLGRVTATGVYVPLNPAANDGSQNFAGINHSWRPASTSTQRGVATVRRAAINPNLLKFYIGVTDAQRLLVFAQMLLVGILIAIWVLDPLPPLPPIPPQPVVLTAPFGANTRRQRGGFDLGYTGGGSLAITSGDPTGIWLISGGRLMIAGTANTAPPVLTGPYTLNISDGLTFVRTVNINIIANARHVATAAELGAHGGAYGETIFLRDGAYVSHGGDAGYARIPLPTGTFTGANYCVLQPDNFRGATLSNWWIGSSAGGGYRVRNCRITSLYTGFGSEAIRPLGNDYIFEFNFISAPGTSGILTPNAINNVGIYDNIFYDIDNAYAMGRTDFVGSNFTAQRNYIVRRTSDAFSLLNCANVLIDSNYSLDKIGGPTSLAHPDFVQLHNSSAAAGAVDLGTCAITNNRLLRGNGLDGGYAADHGVLMSMNASGPYYSLIKVWNNFGQFANRAAVNLNGPVVDIDVRNNTYIYDAGAPDLTGNIGQPSGDSYPLIDVGGRGNVTVKDNIISGPVIASSTGGGVVTVSGNLENQQTLAQHQAIFANPFPNGSGNSGITETDYAARIADAVVRYQTKGAAAGKGAFVAVAA